MIDPNELSLAEMFRKANRGDGVALNQLFSVLYGELHRLARARLRGNRDLTLLQTTALVHESYFRFLKAGQVQIIDRSHFLSYASRVMRSIIVDFFRERSAKRRGGAGKRPANEGRGNALFCGDDRVRDGGGSGRHRTDRPAGLGKGADTSGDCIEAGAGAP